MTCWETKCVLHALAALLVVSLVDCAGRKTRQDRHYQYGGRHRVTQACEESSCYPATGNLLIGREKKLSATSTCGMYGPERFCIVSHLKERKKCFKCNSKVPGEEHGIENIVSRAGSNRRRTWWQSENGVEQVSIRLDTEAEFHFTHLIITFRTFRPAALLIERSHDDGRTWKVYQYYAYNCAESFPGIPIGPRRNITDVTCESKYSAVEPSSGGEVIFRVLPPHIRIADPHSRDVQDLLKMTNLRINFTKLHTLGDNLLDSRREIKEKYYYAIYDMVVRGSCSCYGHASQCIADDDSLHNATRIPDMVYGKCQCTHNTMGLNCESCKPLYNDQQWQPASERDPNPCKLCNCNNHADRCHFDPAVWERSGRVSGGVCDDCRDNTMGISCETCLPFFYKDPQRDITDRYACQPCDCDPRGSLEEGVCDSHDDPAAGLVAGRCHCKSNVESRRCDRCKKGHYNFQATNPFGCQPCTCNELGTIGDGCNVWTGECTCKRNVVGRDCDKCMEFHWGLSQDDDGCKPCDCDPGGAYDNNCDIVTGQCRCRPNVQGRRCDQPETGYFIGNMDFMRYEAELARSSPGCQVLVREPFTGREPTWSGLGFMQVHDDSYLEFDISDVPYAMEYDLVIRYEPKLPRGWEEAEVTVDRLDPVDPNGPCANWITGDDRHLVTFPSGDRHVVVSPVCLEKGKRYKVRIDFKQYDREVDTPKATILIDSIVLLPRPNQIPFFHGSPANEYHREEFERYRCGQAFYTMRYGGPLHDVCKKYLQSIGLLVFNGAQSCECDPQGSHSSVCSTLGGQCQCKNNVIGRRCDSCAPGTYDFGPGGCRPCDCNSIGALDNFCNVQTGQCQCRANTYGRQCDECQPGFWNYPSCQRCECQGHADTCDSKTGNCIRCKDFTAGPRCDRCEIGFYGDPRFGSGIPCRPCPCPGTAESGVSHATSCDLDPHSGNVICHCSQGYVGERCDRCANNYYGEPNVPGGTCRRCECNGNIDDTMPGNCDARTGECLRCLYNTEGPHCERCKPGHYGDASQQQCLECVCNILGMDERRGHCDPVTGQCPCLPNVIGKACDRCAPNFWKIASGEGCEPCDCDPSGSHDAKCNEFDGQCPCKPGHGGRKCNECQANHWGDPRVRCYPCECNVPGAAQAQCHRANGSCICIPGVAGDRCQECARGFTGSAPYCQTCGECFDNWDRIIAGLRQETQDLIDSALQMKQTGSAGAYTKEFEVMQRKLDETRAILDGANITGLDLMDRQNLIEEIRRNLMESQAELEQVLEHKNNLTQRAYSASFNLSDLHVRAENLRNDAEALRANTTALQEANVEGAFNITREAQARSRAAETVVQNAKEDLDQSESLRHLTDHMLRKAASHYNITYHENEKALHRLQQNVSDLEAQIPDLNEAVCYMRSTVDRCDTRCGGAGCDKCGGQGCENGAVTRANNSLEIARDITNVLEQKEKDARRLFSGVSGAKTDADLALEEAKKAFARAQLAKNQSENFSTNLEDLLDRVDRFLNEAAARPSEIRTLAEECLGLSISLEPEQIRELAREINDTIASLTDIDAILKDTAPDLEKAKQLKGSADRAKAKADKILDTAKEVLRNLDDAEQAQKRAQEAINKARENIVTAQGDLAQIELETSGAQDVANNSLDDVAGLQKRLSELKNLFTKNKLDSEKAASEADAAGRMAEKAQEGAQELEDKYTRAMQALQSKSAASGDVKDRAEKLKERARRLAEDVSTKTGQLQQMEDEFDENEKRLKDYSKILEQLNREMTQHLNLIEQRSNYYRVCQN
ncbi:laminin subunit beta-1-like isoform X2 [Ornithodoros turicata]